MKTFNCTGQREERKADGAWTWVVFTAAFFIFGIVGGLHYTTGIFYVSMLEHFRQTYSYTAWIGSLTSAFFLLGGPLAARFIQVFNCKKSAIFGSLLMAVGYLISTFANSLRVVLFGYGFVVSIGMCFCYSSSVVALNQYFGTRHSTMTSYAMTGSGLGLFTLSYMLEEIVSSFGWRIAFMSCAAISLHICALGSLYFSVVNERITKAPETGKSSSSRAGYGALQPHIDELVPNEPEHENIETRSENGIENNVPMRYAEGHNVPESPINVARCNIPESRRNAAEYSSIRDSTVTCLSSYSLSSSVSDNIETEKILMCIREKEQKIISETNQSLGLKYDEKTKREMLYGAEGDSLAPTLEGTVERKTFGVTNDKKTGKTSRVNCFLIKNDSKRMRFRFQFKRCDESCVFLDMKFWLVNFATLLIQGATLTVYVIYKDFFMYRGFTEHYARGLSLIGVGDILGRLLTGIIANFKGMNFAVFYALSMLATSVCLLLFLLPSSDAPTLLVLSALFGLLYGALNVSLVVIPHEIFGQKNLAVVMGQNFFWGGIGALFMPPTAGFIIDVTGLYSPIFYLIASMCALASLVMVLVYYLSIRDKSTADAATPTR